MTGILGVGGGRKEGMHSVLYRGINADKSSTRVNDAYK